MDSARRRMNHEISQRKRVKEDSKSHKPILTPTKKPESANRVDPSPFNKQGDSMQSTGSHELNALMEVLHPHSRGFQINIDDRKASSRSTKPTPHFLRDLGAYGLNRQTSEKRPRTSQLYEATFEKERKLQKLTSKVNSEKGLTFKPHVNSQYKTPKHVKLLTASMQRRQDDRPIDYSNLMDPYHPQRQQLNHSLSQRAEIVKRDQPGHTISTTNDLNS